MYAEKRHRLSRPRNRGVLLACRDTGAANALARVAQHLLGKDVDCTVFAMGPAVEVFLSAGIVPARMFRRPVDRAEVWRIVREVGPSVILQGTSLDSWEERWLTEAARDGDVRCVALVDWWSNFARRFSSPGTSDLRYLPDAVAVPDDDARDGCLAQGIPRVLLHVTGNPYWDHLATLPEGALCGAGRTTRAKMGVPGDAMLSLLVSSNLRNLDLDLGYTERDFFRSIAPLPEFTDRGKPIRWAVKPHPGESAEELGWLLEHFALEAIMIAGIPAFDSVAASDCVLGMCSSVLFEASVMGKKVVSLQPGLRRDRLEYLRIFDRLGIPDIRSAEGAKGVVQDLVNDRLPMPRLDRLPSPLCGGLACESLCNLLSGGKGGAAFS
jgi:hypothetical protein